ncbi:MAG: YjgN family protein [Methylophagaceae bacterium]
MKSLEFNGSGTEYFKIWIVNILLTIVTLGIYHPWAKVRTKRYFYGNTELDNANFEYHATGKQLFISYLIAMVIFAIYVGLGQVFPIVGGILAVVFFLAFPWIIWRSLKFNLRMTSYRNVRFGFNAGVGGSYATFLAYPIGMMLALGIIAALIMGVIGSVMDMQAAAGILMGLFLLFAYPAFLAMFNKISSSYLTNGAHFGQGQFAADLEFKPFFMIMLKGLGLGLLLTILAVILIGVLAYFVIGMEQMTALNSQMESMKQGAEPDALFFALIGSVYAFLIPVSLYVVAYFKARHRTYLLNETTLDNSITFESTLRANKFFTISLTNLLMIIFTLGLAYPWAAVRMFRYSTESIDVGTAEGFDGYMSKAGNEGALGEELGEAFDIDVGGIAF